MGFGLSFLLLSFTPTQLYSYYSSHHDLRPSLLIPIDEERVTNGELKALGDLINEIERHISRSIIEGDGGAGLLAVATARREV